MSGGGGFISFMNSTLRRNRQLLKKKRSFKERSQLYDVSDHKKVNYQMKDLSEEEKTLKRKLKKSENDKTTILYFLMIIIILSISLNIYFGFFNETEEKNPSRKRLEKLYLAHIKVGDVYIRSKNWDNAIGNYKNSIKYFPEKFIGHQKLLFALTEKCKEKDYESCIEARNYISDIRNIFLEKKDELNKYLSDINKYQKRIN